jgi:2-C-methyl-D-erythritol 4-phosphate cytidylyltransferase
VAAGSGTRFGSSTPKQFLPLGEKPLLFHSVHELGGLGAVRDVIVVVPKHYVRSVRRSGQMRGIKKPWRVIAGGERRQDSVYRALRAIKADTKIVLIHDGVRPFVPIAAVKRAIASARKFGAAIVALPATDTVKIADRGRRVVDTMPRERVWLAQTPQVFRAEIIRRAYREVRRRGLDVTDDAAAVEAIGGKVNLVVGSSENLKVTTRRDFQLAERMLQEKKKRGSRSPRLSRGRL